MIMVETPSSALEIFGGSYPPPRVETKESFFIYITTVLQIAKNRATSKSASEGVLARAALLEC